MAKKKVITEKRYIVHWYSNGFCYKSTSDCPKEYVTNCRKVAKALGETIKVEIDRVIKHEYTF